MCCLEEENVWLSGCVRCGAPQPALHEHCHGCTWAAPVRLTRGSRSIRQPAGFRWDSGNWWFLLPVVLQKDDVAAWWAVCLALPSVSTRGTTGGGWGLASGLGGCCCRTCWGLKAGRLCGCLLCVWTTQHHSWFAVGSDLPRLCSVPMAAPLGLGPKVVLRLIRRPSAGTGRGGSTVTRRSHTYCKPCDAAMS